VESEEVPARLTQYEESFSMTRIALNDCVTQYEKKSPFTSFKKRIFHNRWLKRDEQRIKISSATSNY